MELITDDLSTDNREFRLQLIANFKAIANSENNVDDLISILKKYGVPVSLVDGKIVEEEN